MRILNAKFVKCAPIENRVPVHEFMIKYCGKHSCKQFIPIKLICFGYKIWSLALKNGYRLYFDVYQDKNAAYT